MASRRAVKLPRSPEALAKLLRGIEAHARKLADEQERIAFEQRPESVRQAVSEAVSYLYFHGDKESAARKLEKIIDMLAPEIWRTIDERGIRVAYRVINPEDEEE